MQTFVGTWGKNINSAVWLSRVAGVPIDSSIAIVPEVLANRLSIPMHEYRIADFCDEDVCA